MASLFIVYTDLEPLTLDSMKEKAVEVFFPDGLNRFAGKSKDMLISICDMTHSAIFEFPGSGTVNDYLKSRGLYPSSTYFYLRTQPKHLLEDEFDDATFSDETSSDQAKASLELDNVPEASQSDMTDSRSSSPLLSPFAQSTSRVICEKCSCTFLAGETCIRCEQNEAYKDSLLADSKNNANEHHSNRSDRENVFVNETLPDRQQLREYRLSHLLRGSSSASESNPESIQTSSSSTSQNNPVCIQASSASQNDPERIQAQEVESRVEVESQDRESDSDQPDGNNPEKLLKVHRTCICSDLIKHFKDKSVMKADIVFKIINERGEEEDGIGSGVTREVYTLFWKEFANSMLIGERERVPFIRHDHFIDEWEAVGRIVVKGYASVGYFPMFISRAFICYCLFGEDLPDDIILQSFLKYLSPGEEELLKSYFSKSSFPDDDDDELYDFLERFNSRAAVTPANFDKVIMEIARQELFQRPHVMLS